MPVSVNRKLGATDRCSPSGAVISAFLSAIIEDGTIVGWMKNSAFSVQEVQSDGSLTALDLTAAALVVQADEADTKASRLTPPVISGSTTPPSINIQGNNPATIHVGDTYIDVGAIVTDNEAHSLDYKTFLNGALVSNIVIDTSKIATDTIDYVATDTWGNTTTSSRIIIVQAPIVAPPATTTTP